MLWLFVGILTGWLLLSVIGAYFATKGFPKKIPELKTLGAHKVEELEFYTSDSIKISAWWVHNTSPEARKQKKAVILMAGVWSDRTSNIQRARLYLEKGYSVLLPDLRATGKSAGSYHSFGWQERKDLAALVDYLRGQDWEVGVHGISLGAATIVYSFQEEKDYSFVILEACYDNIHNAFLRRARVLSLDNFWVRPFRFLVTRRLQAQPLGLAPEKYIEYYKGPLLILAGGADQWVYTEDTQKLYQNAQSESKDLAWIEGARHEDLLAFDPQAYGEIFDSFIKKLP